MKLFFREDGESVSFVVSDYPEAYRSVLESQYYTESAGEYVKKYPKDVGNIVRVKENYLRYAEEMFAQMGYFRETPWEQALLEFIGRVRGRDIGWWLTGSCALCVRGIEVGPHDVDIMLDSKDIERIRDIFSDCIVEPVTSSGGWVVDYFGVLFLHARIDLAFDPQADADLPQPSDFGLCAKRHLEEVVWRGNILKVPPLGLQLEVNRRRGRLDRVRAIEEYLGKK